MKNLLFVVLVAIGLPAVAHAGPYNRAACDSLDVFLARSAQHIRAAEAGDITMRKAGHLIRSDRDAIGARPNGEIVRGNGLDIVDRQLGFAENGMDYDRQFRANMKAYCLKNWTH